MKNQHPKFTKKIDNYKEKTTTIWTKLKYKKTLMLIMSYLTFFPELTSLPQRPKGLYHTTTFQLVVSCK